MEAMPSMHRVLNSTLPSTHTRVLLASLVLSQHKCPMTAGPLGTVASWVLMSPQCWEESRGLWSEQTRPGIHAQLEAGHPRNCHPIPSLEPQGHASPCNPTPKDRSPQPQSLGNNFYHLHRFFIPKSQMQENCLRHPCTHIAR